MADYAPGYDPSHANYQSTSEQAWQGLMTLTAFAAIGVGAFSFIPLTATVEFEGVIYYGVSPAIAQIIAVLRTAEMSGAGQATLESIVRNALAGVPGGNAMTVGALLYISSYDPFYNWEDYNHFDVFLGSSTVECYTHPPEECPY